ncbi:MAG: hypothetical protein JWQ09_2210, partial [Segetibacter sp.]|nr:hypothetical protein [Segetibacter sp.]
MQLLLLLVSLKNMFFNVIKKHGEVLLLKGKRPFLKIFNSPVFSRLFTKDGNKRLGSKRLGRINAISFITLFLVLFGSTASAQQLGDYPFTGFLLATCPNNNNTVSGQAANVNFSPYTNVGASCSASTTDFENFNWNQSNTINTGEYNQFTVSPASGYVLTLTSLTFNQYYSVKPISTWYLRSSIDGFSSNIGSGTITNSSQLATVSLSAANFTNIGSVTFRLYVVGALNSNAVWINDNVTLNGSAIKIPDNPANPTSNSPQCANPGVTLTRTGAPSGPEVWYWQSTSTGTSTAKPQSTCTVNTSGTYYIRAMDTVNTLWSLGAGSLAVTITPNVGVPVFAMGATSGRCQAAGTVTYAATATNNTGITYSLDAASTTAGNTVDPTTGMVTYHAAWYGTSIITATATGCNGPTTANHTVTTNAPVTVPVFNFGATSVICQASGTITYTATAFNAAGITYTLDGASISGGNSINAPTGAVTYAAAWSGTSVITATAAGCNGPLTSTHTVTITPTVGVPVFTMGATSSRCIAAETINYSATATTNTGITYSLDATSIAGGNIIDANTGDVTYAAGWSGTSTITASAAGCNGPKTSTHTVTTNLPVTTPVFNLTATSVRCQGAGPVTYTATANYTTGLIYSLDASSITGGNSINTATGQVTYAASWIGTSVITATATGCNGPTTASHTVSITAT